MHQTPAKGHGGKHGQHLQPVVLVDGGVEREFVISLRGLIEPSGKVEKARLRYSARDD
jgi:hypothetical protein